MKVHSTMLNAEYDKMSHYWQTQTTLLSELLQQWGKENTRIVKRKTNQMKSTVIHILLLSCISILLFLLMNYIISNLQKVFSEDFFHN